MKVKKAITLTIIGIALVLSAIFLYINNDLVISKAKKRGTTGITVAVSKIDPTGKQDEASLDAVFGGEEPADNFDDIVM